MSTPHLFDFVINRVRIYIRDSKELNKLLGNKFESDDTAVRQAIIDAINDWNISQPPLTPIDLRTHPAKLLLVRKACVELMKSAMIWHSREHMPSQDGGTSADDHAKFAEYSQWIGMIEADYETKKSALKVSMNVAQCFGGLASEYSYGWEDWGYNFRSVDMVSGYPPNQSGTGTGGTVDQGGDPFFDPMEEGQAPVSGPPVAEPTLPERTGDVLTFILTHSNAPSKKLFRIPANATVYEIRVQVETAFTGLGGPIELTVGDAGQTDRLAQAIESDMATVGTYVINVDYTYAAAEDIYVYIANVPIIGKCKVILTYDTAQ
jgi:hypothetical protein